MIRANATGGIFSSDSGQFFKTDDFFVPFITVNVKDGDLVKNYMINAKNATVSIKFIITLLGTKPATQVAYFSSRGPSQRSPWILKPDILAPGVNILAAGFLIGPMHRLVKIIMLICPAHPCHAPMQLA